MTILRDHRPASAISARRARSTTSISTIEEGEFVSLVGPNGAGKTSLINVISAHLHARIRARSLSRARTSRGMSVTERVKAGIARSFQLVNLFDDLTRLRQRGAGDLLARGQDRAIWRRSPHLDEDVNREADRRARTVRAARPRRDGSAARPRAGRTQAARRGACLRAEAQAAVPRRADQRRQHPRQGQIMDTIASVVRAEGITAVDHRARHGCGVQLFRPHRGHAPGRHSWPKARPTRSGTTSRSP